jgi:small neutral amino acid transporter SnatA (MarC family)
MPKIADPGDPATPVDPGAPGDGGDPAKVRRAYLALIRAAVLEMALGVFYAVFGFAGRGSFHVYAGLVIIAGGFVILGVALRVRSKSRAG